MDADFSHSSDYLPALETTMLRNSHDVVIGSRYVAGGSTRGWNWRRRLISRFGNFYSRCILQIPIRDLTGGFNAWKAEILRAIDLSTIESNGYMFQIAKSTVSNLRCQLI